MVGGVLAASGFLVFSGAFHILTNHSLDFSVLEVLRNTPLIAVLPALGIASVLLMSKRRGYHLVRQHFVALARAVAGHSGAVVKTIGDEVMAAFADPVDAVSASIDIAREVEEMNRSHSDRLRLKMGIHGGHCLLVTLNKQLDYFGQTVNIAYRVLRLAKGGELCLKQ